MTDFRALCAELVDCLEKANWPLRHKTVFGICLDDARAALTQPEPQGPTDEELSDTYWKAWHEHFDRTNSVLHAVGLRAVLARWGNQ